MMVCYEKQLQEAAQLRADLLFVKSFVKPL
jgi:hypothetical protein